MVINLLVQLLREYRVGYPIRPKHNQFYSKPINECAVSVYLKQRKYGPKILTKGFLIKEWEALHDLCPNASNPGDTNLEWATKVIQALW